MSRAVIATVLAVLGCLLAGPAVAAFALERDLTNQERYLARVAPLAEDPAVRAEIAGRLSAELNERLGPGDRDLPDSLRRVVDRAVTAAVDSDTFRTGWVTVNRAAHPEVLAMLRDETATLRIDGDTVRLDLGVLMDEVRARLVAEDVPFAERLPDVDASVPLLSRPSVRQAIPAFATLEALHLVLPIVALALLITAGTLAPRRALPVAGAGLALAMLALAAVLWINRDRVVARSESPVLAGAFYDAITGDLKLILWIVFGVAVAAALTGLLARLARRA